MIRAAAGDRIHGQILDNGCGVGQYLHKMEADAERSVGLEYDRDFAREARQRAENVVRAAAEALPFPPDSFDLVLSHEVLEHVEDDRQALREIVRVLRPADPENNGSGGRLVLFVPNRGYPFETHGIYWRGRYRFGNIPLVNYLPRPLRNRIAPHVRTYTEKDLSGLFEGLPVEFVKRTVIFGAYDNIINRWPRLGRMLRAILQALESTPLRRLGLSHLWVVEKR
jgi:SAM-dependent methyltransferase